MAKYTYDAKQKGTKMLVSVSDGSTTAKMIQEIGPIDDIRLERKLKIMKANAVKKIDAKKADDKSTQIAAELSKVRNK